MIHSRAIMLGRRSIQAAIIGGISCCAVLTGTAFISDAEAQYRESLGDGATGISFHSEWSAQVSPGAPTTLAVQGTRQNFFLGTSESFQRISQLEGAVWTPALPLWNVDEGAIGGDLPRPLFDLDRLGIFSDPHTINLFSADAIRAGAALDSDCSLSINDFEVTVNLPMNAEGRVIGVEHAPVWVQREALRITFADSGEDARQYVIDRLTGLGFSQSAVEDFVDLRISAATLISRWGKRGEMLSGGTPPLPPPLPRPVTPEELKEALRNITIQVTTEAGVGLEIAKVRTSIKGDLYSAYVVYSYWYQYAQAVLTRWRDMYRRFAFRTGIDLYRRFFWWWFYS